MRLFAVLAPALATILLTALPPGAGAAHPPSDAALIEAAAAGDTPRVVRLLASGAAVKARDARGRSALLAATQGNHLEAAQALIKAGADVNAKDDIADSPYLLAGARGYVEILRLTLAAGADLKSTNRYGGTALTPACHYGHVEAVRELLKTRVDIDHVNNLGWTCLLEAVILGDGGPRHVEIVRMVINAGARVNLADAQGMTPLAHALSRGQAQVADLLVKAGAR